MSGFSVDSYLGGSVTVHMYTCVQERHSSLTLRFNGELYVGIYAVDMISKISDVVMMEDSKRVVYISKPDVRWSGG